MKTNVTLWACCATEYAVSALPKILAFAFITIIASAAACGGEDATPTPPSNAPAENTPGASSSGGPTESSGTPVDPSKPNPTSPTPATCQGREKLSGDLDWTLKPSGTDRTVHVHIPPSYDPTKAVPIVLDFHGYTSNPSQQAGFAGMIAKSDAAGFVAVHAEGTGSLKSWNAGACCGTAATDKTEDVAFVNAILDQLVKKLCVDEKRIFSTGLSNGGFLSYRLACEMSGRIAAIAPVAAVMGIPTCTPTRPVPIMHFHGTSDQLVPYNGNNNGYPSVAVTTSKWAERNGCTDKPRETFKKDDVTCMTQDKCNAGAEITVCTVDGGGHTWPGSKAVMIGLGKITQAINATDAMWDFFQKHPMP
jgi:polyhydroxybutyrate depolymerase